MKDSKNKTLDLEKLLLEVSEYRSFSGEDGNAELSEDDLELISAARAIPNYREFLKKLNREKINEE